jgi:septum formation protein
MSATSKRKIILASGSPRRKELLSTCGFEFDVKTKNTDETHPEGIPQHLIPEFLAVKKAEAFLAEIKDEIIIAADTIVILNGKIYEKPTSKEDAIKMLEALSGNTHIVITGVCIMTKDEKIVFSETTEVRFAQITKSEIEFYVDSFKPFDKAGAYACQEWIGAIGIESFKGSYHNVVGLPTHKVYEILKKLI